MPDFCGDSNIEEDETNKVIIFYKFHVMRLHMKPRY